MPGKGRPFQPGQSGNPSGGKKLPADVQEARTLNAIELSRVLNRFLHMSKDEVKAAVEAPGTPMIDIIAGSMMARIAKEGGDPARLNIVLERLLGKVKDYVEVTGTQTMEYVLKPETKALLDLLGPQKPKNGGISGS